MCRERRRFRCTSGFERGCPKECSACNNLANIHLTGQIGARDVERALSYQEKACNEGNRGCLDLANMLLWEAKRDEPRALSLYKAVCGKLNEVACARFEWLSVKLGSAGGTLESPTGH